MKEQYTLKENIIIAVTFLILGAILGIIFCEVLGYNFKNIMFVGGLILLTVSIFAGLTGGNVKLSGNTLGEMNAEYVGSGTLKLSRLSGKEEKGIEFSKNFIENIFSNYILVPSAVIYIIIGLI